MNTFIYLKEHLDQLENPSFDLNCRVQSLMSIVKYIDGINHKDQLYINMLTMITEAINEHNEILLQQLVAELRYTLIGGKGSKGIIVISEINEYSKVLISHYSNEYVYISLDETNQDFITGYNALIWCGASNKDLLLKWGELCNLENFIDMQMVCFHTFFQIPSAYSTDIKNAELLLKDNPDCLITGMSYIRNCINTHHLDIAAINTASSSSDLYYDYLTYKDIIGKCNSIKKIIIGLAPYSLRYDLSLAKREYERSRLHYLYDKFSDAHNCIDLKSLEDYSKYKQQMISLWGVDCLTAIFHSVCNDKRIKYLNRINTTFDPNNINPAEKEQMTGKYNKPYPNTISENKKILYEYIASALSNNIEVLLLIPPYSDWYKEHWNIDYKYELIDYINELKETFQSIVLLDFSEFKLPDYMFGDYAHVNILGAIYISNIINEYLTHK